MIEALKQQVDRGIRGVSSDAGVLAVFTATIFLSALLLFSVQPIFAKMVLPNLGGTPAVWAVSMCFFQGALLAGYCYAHLLNRYAPPRLAPVLHLGLLAVAWLTLPFGLPAGTTPPAGDAYLWLIGVLALGIGLPFFAISANAPLLQAWFARSGHPHANDPYFLYGASNLGSLLALLAYPVAIEPMLTLAGQSSTWGFGFTLLGAAIAVSAVAMVQAALARGLALDVPVAARSGSERAEVAVTLRDRFVWIGLAFVPSGLLVAFTTHLTTDIASAPFLWVLPLAAFLATFIAVFRDQSMIPEAFMRQALGPAVAAALIAVAAPSKASSGMLIGAAAIAFLLVTLSAHRELFLARPAASRLTEFYLWMSLGGVLGGVFAAIVAPQLFSTVFEYPLLLAAGLVCQRHFFAGWSDEDRSSALRIAAGAALVMAVASVATWLVPGEIDLVRAFAVIAALGAMLIWRTDARRTAMTGFAVLAGILIVPSSYQGSWVERSFFGVHRVADTPDGQFRLVFHGTTIHGAERIRTASGAPVDRPVPATYFHAASPLAVGFDVAREATGKTGGGLRYGLVGLGAGSLACYVRPNETMRIYEIDPVVVKIATNPRQFRFLPMCQPKPDVVVGDARLTVAREPAGRFDYLTIDAFSSDAVPVHLMTAQSIAMYLDKVSAAGLVALHVSNRFMDLYRVAAVTAKSVPGAHVATMVRLGAKDESLDASPSMVVFVSRSAETIARVRALPGAIETSNAPIRPWTDDYSDVLSAVIRHARQ